MTHPRPGPPHAHPALLCFDGSDDAAAAIAKAGELSIALHGLSLLGDHWLKPV